jgi:hypothetical protein
MKEHEPNQEPPITSEPRNGDLRFVPGTSDGGTIEALRDREWVEALVALDGEAPLAEWLVEADRKARDQQPEPSGS